jgi:anti-sigma regulatory factor (Ser/Thr protein kinase)
MPMLAWQGNIHRHNGSGKRFDFEKAAGYGLMSDPLSEHGRGIHLMKAYMDNVHFERGGSEVHMRKRLGTVSRS